MLILSWWCEIMQFSGVKGIWAPYLSGVTRMKIIEPVKPDPFPNIACGTLQCVGLRVGFQWLAPYELLEVPWIHVSFSRIISHSFSSCGFWRLFPFSRIISHTYIYIWYIYTHIIYITYIYTTYIYITYIYITYIYIYIIIYIYIYNIYIYNIYIYNIYIYNIYIYI